jgi:outer membrane protein TolC
MVKTSPRVTAAFNQWRRNGLSARLRRACKRHVAIAIAVASASGCAVGPDFQRPAAPDVVGYTPERLARQTASASDPRAHAQVLFPGRDIPGEWWKLLHSKSLTSLVEKALAANPDLQAAQAALRVARENVYVQQGNLFPSLDGNFSATRQKVPDDAFGNTPDPAIFNLFTGQLNVSYVPDVFGGTRGRSSHSRPWRKVSDFSSKPRTSR